MKKFSILILFFAVVSNSLAQITIQEANMPQANMIYQLSNAANNGNDQTIGGENITWDYSDLVEIVAANDTTIGIDNAEGIFQLVFNNPVLFPDYVSDYFTSGQGFDLGALTVDEVSNFFAVTPNYFEQTGFGAVLNGTAAPVIYNPKDIIYELPMNFGDSTFNFAYFEADIPTLGFWSEEIFRSNEVEGWGTLILPSGTFDVLKVKTTINRTDSIFVSFLGFGSTFDQPETIEYKWLSSTEMTEVLTITEVLGQVTNVTYFNDSEVISSLEFIEEEEIIFYPNPANDEIFFRNSLNIFSVKLLNSLGQVILEHQSNTSISQLDIQDISSGIYYLVLNDLSTKKIMINR